VTYSGGPLTAGDEGLKAYAPDAISTSRDTDPVALFGVHNSARIVAQQGVLTIFGSERVPMETLVRTGAFPARALSRIVINPSRILAMRTSLLDVGITESTIFPDLEGLARETRRHFGFEF